MSGASTMKVLQIEAPGRPVWREAPKPLPGPGEVLVRIEAVATCPHWDLHIMGGEPMFPGMKLDYPYMPGQPGHEAVGRVEALGQGVVAPAVGARVAVWRDTGARPLGCYAQYNVLRAEDMIEVPEDLEPADIASLELTMCVEVAFQALARLGGVAGRRVGLAGLGPAGLVAVQLARANGAAEVVGFDPVAERRALALQLGAHRALAPEASAWPAGRGEGSLDMAIDLTGVPAAIEFLMDRTSVAVALFGVLREEVRFGSRHLFGPGLVLMGYGDHNRAAAETARRMIASRQVRLAPLITRRLPMRDYAAGVDLLRSKQAIKVLFDPWA